MRITQKIAIVLVLPLLIMLAYHMVTVTNAFDRIADARALIFVQSAEEVKHASQVQNTTSLMSSKLFEISVYQRSGDIEKLSNTVRLFRELQQQRYHSFRQLQEAIVRGGYRSDAFLDYVDANREIQLTEIGERLASIDEANEQIISRMGLQPTISSENGAELDALFLVAANHSRELDELLGSFVEQRYQKVTKTSESVEEVERKAEESLLFGVLMGYLISAIMLVYIHYLVVKPMEKFAQLFAFDDPSKINWSSFERARDDEMGRTLRGIESLYARLHSKKKNTDLIGKKPKRNRKKSLQ